jgi:lambda repressor-like predicted transcriptional regulator
MGTHVDLSVAAIAVNRASATAVDADQPSHSPFRAAMDAAANALGMQPQDLFSALRSGQSLADVASSKGVSQDQLVSAMSSAITQANSGINTDQAMQIATRIATQVPGNDGRGAPMRGVGGAASGHHHHHHRGGGDLLSAAAAVLGQSTSTVMSALQGGQSLATLGSTTGVSQDQLVTAIETALQRDNPNLTTDQAAQFATAFVTAAGQDGSQVDLSA